MRIHVFKNVLEIKMIDDIDDVSIVHALYVTLNCICDAFDE